MLKFEDWSDYYAATLDKPLHPLFAQLDPHLPHAGQAIELGCGVGHGVLHLLGKGLDVLAVDSEQEALELVEARVPDELKPRLALVRSRFQDLSLPAATYDVAVAGFSLFFLEQEEFELFWARLVGAIRPGGLFAGELLGVRDDWVSRGYAVHSREDVERLLAAFEVLHLEEAERDGFTAMGTPKHWHVFHIVARKRG